MDVCWVLLVAERLAPFCSQHSRPAGDMTPAASMQSALLMYQHGDKQYDRPDLVPADNWHMRSEHSSNVTATGNATEVRHE